MEALRTQSMIDILLRLSAFNKWKITARLTWVFICRRSCFILHAASQHDRTDAAHICCCSGMVEVQKRWFSVLNLQLGSLKIRIHVNRPLLSPEQGEVAFLYSSEWSLPSSLSGFECCRCFSMTFRWWKLSHAALPSLIVFLWWYHAGNCRIPAERSKAALMKLRAVVKNYYPYIASYKDSTRRSFHVSIGPGRHQCRQSFWIFSLNSFEKGWNFIYESGCPSARIWARFVISNSFTRFLSEALKAPARSPPSSKLTQRTPWQKNGTLTGKR